MASAHAQASAVSPATDSGVDAPDADLAEFLAHTRPAGSMCGIRKALEAMDPDQARKFRAALSPSSGIQTVAIQATIKDWGFTLGADGLRRHRRGVCSCDQTT